jgi:hypothetical protein
MEEANNDTKESSSNMYCKFKQWGEGLIINLTTLIIFIHFPIIIF